MANYLVVKILESHSVSLPSTLNYGCVELRSHTSDSESEVEKLKESAKSHKADFEQYLYCARIAVIVNADDIESAKIEADKWFSEVLDIKSVEFFISNVRVSNIGFVKNLDTGSLNSIFNQEFSPSISFVVHQGDVQRVDVAKYILALNNELSARYLRSLHWMRNARHEKNAQIKILFLWFSLEALFKFTEDDSIIGVVRWFLGFPNSGKIKDLPLRVVEQIKEHPSYSYWNKELPKVLDRIRIFRNDSVHSGFRSVDFTRKELELYERIMTLGASRCQSAVQYALINQVSTVPEFKEYIPLLYEECVRADDVHGNIIYSLDKILNL